MYAEGTHVCMLPQEPKYYDLPPTAGFHRHLLSKIRLLMLPCAWHHGSALFARSQRRLQRERDRQLRGSWFIWHPYSPIKFYWDCITNALTFVTCLYMPLQVFYKCPNPYDPFILISDGFTFLNIGTNFITGQDHEDGKEVTLEPKTIAKQYLSRLFILDLISALPLQCFPLFEDCNHPTHTVWLILKLFRIISMREKWKNFHKQIALSYVHTVAITVFARILFFFHWMTYIHYQVPTFCFHYYKQDPQTFDWFKRLRVTDYETVSSVFQKYTSNLYYVCGMCNGSGRHTPVDKYSIPEMTMNSIIGILGLVFITYAFTTLLRLAMYSRFEMFLYSGRLKELTDYMLFKKLPKSLQHKIQLFINYKFYEHYFNERAIMNTINEQIKQDINMHCCKKLVVNVPLFQDMPVALINTIVFSMIQVLFMPGELVVKCDEPGHLIYFISSGTVAVINSNGREVAHLRDGAYFGESALLDPGVLRTVTIIALEITEIYTLNAKDFTSCLQPYPHLKRRLEESSKGNMGQRRTRNKYAK